MNKTKTVAARPPKAERDELRRNEIVDAAKICVVRHGFHGASMGQIAAQAAMSVGQIYRYFASKEAIVHAIVERKVAKQLVIMSRGRVPDVAKMLAQRDLYDSQEDEDDHTLMLEVGAEATRNAAVAAMVRDADRRLTAEAVANLRRTHPNLTEGAAQARIEFMTALFNGTALRRSAPKVVEPELLADLYQKTIDQVLLIGAPVKRKK